MIYISLKQICKASMIVFMFYICWYLQSFGDNHLILYGTFAVGFGCMLLDLLLSGQVYKRMFPIGVSINVIMCLYSLFTGIFFAYDQNMLFSTVKTYFAFSGICMVIAYICFYDGFEWVIKTLICISVACCLQVAFRGVRFEGYGYTMGIHNNPNSIGLVLDLGIFALAYDSNQSIPRFIKSLLLAALFIFFVIYSGSRKCLLGGCLILALWATSYIIEAYKNGSGFQKFVVTFALLIVVGIGIRFYFSYYILTESYKRMIVLGSSAEGSGSNRLTLYKIAFDYFVEHPFFGIGLGQYEALQGLYSHSTYAEAIASWGVIGSVMYFSPIIMTTLTAVRYSFDRKNNFRMRIILALIVMELFIATGQIFFYEVEHMVAWTIICCFVDYSVLNPETVNNYEYIDDIICE